MHRPRKTPQVQQYSNSPSNPENKESLMTILMRMSLCWAHTRAIIVAPNKHISQCQ